MSTSSRRRLAHHARWLLVAAAVLALFAAARLLPLAQWTETLLGRIEALGLWAPLVFALVCVVAVVLMAPAWVLTVAAGAAFGLALGTATASLASTLGAILAFLVARYLARERAARYLGRHPKFQAVDGAIGREGWKIVALLRLSPAIPFNLQNYLYGLTAIRFWPFALASWVAMLPGTFMYVYLGYAGRSVLTATAGDAAERDPLQWAMLCVGLLATVTVTVYVTRLARRAIREHMQKTETSNAVPT